ncbi:MAG: hypothetical protein MUF49_25150 [Oculatellaceae cyanobacterium Prado106]|jgi:hypothetical protein|nr:hypothetical protein [Oculatellaceae cyanobacterium Prado106]
MKYPKWFPYPSSWLNALLLAGLISVSGYITEDLYGDILQKTFYAGRIDLLMLIVAIALLSPILIITFVHHWIHLLLSRYAPDLQAPEIGQVKGFMPTLFSWWEGILGWSTMALSGLFTLVVGLILYITLGVGLSQWQLVESDRPAQIFAAVTWLTSAAYLYHCSYLVEQRLIAFNEKS